jgi:hypothetical protein
MCNLIYESKQPKLDCTLVHLQQSSSFFGDVGDLFMCQIFAIHASLMAIMRNEVVDEEQNRSRVRKVSRNVLFLVAVAAAKANQLRKGQLSLSLSLSLACITYIYYLHSPSSPAGRQTHFTERILFRLCVYLIVPQ